MSTRSLVLNVGQTADYVLCLGARHIHHLGLSSVMTERLDRAQPKPQTNVDSNLMRREQIPNSWLILYAGQGVRLPNPREVDLD